MKRRALLAGLIGVLFSGFSNATAATKKPTPKATAKSKVTKKPTPTAKPSKPSVTASPAPTATVKPAPQELALSVDGVAIEIEKLIAPTSIYASIFKAGREHKLLVAKPREGIIKIFTAHCPHQGNILNLAAGGEFQCDRHGARFDDLTGKVLAGPTVNSLDQYEPIIKNGILYITI